MNSDAWQELNEISSAQSSFISHLVPIEEILNPVNMVQLELTLVYYILTRYKSYSKGGCLDASYSWWSLVFSFRSNSRRPRYASASFCAFSSSVRYFSLSLCNACSLPSSSFLALSSSACRCSSSLRTSSWTCNSTWEGINCWCCDCCCWTSTVVCALV